MGTVPLRKTRITELRGPDEPRVPAEDVAAMPADFDEIAEWAGHEAVRPR
jgi:hypothetical protein